MSLRLCLSVALFLVSLASRTAWAQEGGGTASLHGCVTDAEAGVPLPNVHVHLAPSPARAAAPADTVGTSTDAAGCFRLAGLAPGGYTLAARAVGYGTARRPVRLAPGTARRLDVALRPEAVRMGEIVVRADPDRPETASSTVHRLPLATLARTDAVAVADLGAQIPSARVQTNSRGEALLYLRNAGERQVALFFDGAPLNVPWDNRANLSLVPAAALGGVTVAQGVPSVRYGTNVLGGAANLVARRRAREGVQTDVRLRGAVPAAGEGSVTHLRRHGRWHAGATAGYATRGDVALPDARLPFSQPASDRRTNTDRTFAHALVRGGVDVAASGARLGLTALHVDGTFGVAPESHLDPAAERVRYWRYPTWRRSLVILHGAAPLGAGGASVRGAAWGSRFRQAIDQYDGVAYDRLRARQTDTDRTVGARLVAEQPTGRGPVCLALHVLTSTHVQENADAENAEAAAGLLGPSTRRTFRQHLGSVGLEWAAEATPRTTLVLGASLDGTATPATGGAPRPGPLFAPGLTAHLAHAVAGALTLKAAAGRKVRFPTPRERFGAALGRFVPNPALRPETALLAEAGLAWEAGRGLRAEATAFLNRTYGTLDQRTLPDGRRQRVNLDGSRVVGVEVAARGSLGARLRLDGHLTWTHARAQTDPGGSEAGRTRLAERPAWLGTLGATLDLPARLALLVQPRLVAGAYAPGPDGAFARLPGALVLDARLAHRLPGARGLVFVRVENATDEAAFFQRGLPAPGRTLRMGLEVTW